MKSVKCLGLLAVLGLFSNSALAADGGDVSYRCVERQGLGSPMTIHTNSATPMAFNLRSLEIEATDTTLDGRFMRTGYAGGMSRRDAAVTLWKESDDSAVAVLNLPNGALGRRFRAELIVTKAGSAPAYLMKIRCVRN